VEGLTSKIAHLSFDTTTGFFVAVATLKHTSYTANDLLQRPLVTKQSWLAMMTSNCLPFRERAFNLLVEFAVHKNLATPVALGKCHGDFPDTSQWANDR